MGTRADFYVGRGMAAEWIGSVAWDGYPSAIDDAVKQARTPEAFRAAVAKCLGPRDDFTTPEQGWPWPLDTSTTTDYAYAIDSERVHASCFGEPWFDPTLKRPLDEHQENEDEAQGARAEFPDMTSRKNVTFGERSGVLIFGR